MSAHSSTIHLPSAERLKPGKFPLTALFAGLSLLGIVLSIIAALVDKEQFAYSYFFAFYYFFTIALGSFFWVVLHYACDSAWSVIIRRTWENILALLPLFFVLFIPFCIPGHLNEVLWKWMGVAHSSDPELAKRSVYLNGSFFYLRVAAYFLYFSIAGLYYRRSSIAQDRDGNPVHTRRMNDHSYMALVIFGVLETFIGFDWFMGLDWHWASSLFGVYNFGVCAQVSMAACIVLVALFRSGGYLKALTFEHYYMMGKLLFGFTIFWAYVAFGQYLLIWYANIPEETIFYNDHNRYHWFYLTYFLAVGKFMFPAIYLLAQDVKKSLRGLTFIAGWILFMHGVEIYWFVAPYAHNGVLPKWQDFVCFLTVGSILGYAYLKIAASASLFPNRDPRLVECLTITN